MRYTWLHIEDEKPRVISEFDAEVAPTFTFSDIAARYTAGGMVAIPTDTVYGLSAAVGTEGVVAIFSAKGRPAEVALPVLVSGLDMALGLMRKENESELARLRCLSDAFWPGALTIVLSRATHLDFDIGGLGSETIGLRFPRSPLLASIISAVGPIVATSANRHRHPPIESVGEFFHRRNLPLLGLMRGMLQDKRVGSRISSTVVDITGAEPKILRRGQITEADVLSALAQRGLASRLS